MSEIRRTELLVLVLDGRTLSFVLAAYVGEGAAGERYWFVLAVVGALVALTVVVGWYRERIVNATSR